MLDRLENLSELAYFVKCTFVNHSETNMIDDEQGRSNDLRSIVTGVRAEKRLSQSQLATDLGVAQSTLSHFETEDAVPSVEILFKLFSLADDEQRVKIKDAIVTSQSKGDRRSDLDRMTNSAIAILRSLAIWEDTPANLRGIASEFLGNWDKEKGTEQKPSSRLVPISLAPEPKEFILSNRFFSPEMELPDELLVRIANRTIEEVNIPNTLRERFDSTELATVGQVLGTDVNRFHEMTGIFGHGTLYIKEQLLAAMAIWEPELYKNVYHNNLLIPDTPVPKYLLAEVERHPVGRVRFSDSVTSALEEADLKTIGLVIGKTRLQLRDALRRDFEIPPMKRIISRMQEYLSELKTVA